MISLMYSQSCLSMASIIFYTCVLIPLREVKSSVVTIVSLIFMKHAEQSAVQEVTVCLSVSKYEEVEEEEEMCSICLMEFEREDVVSRLSRCGHVFHMDCIERWLDCNHFTCPLCRSFLLINVQSSQPNKCHFH